VWIWIGGALIGLGTIWALVPARKRQVLPASRASIEEPVGEPA